MSDSKIVFFRIPSYKKPSYTPTKTKHSFLELEFSCTTRLIKRLTRMMAGGLQRTPSRTEQRRAISCERSREEMIGAMMHEAASATKPKKHKSADVTTIVDSRFTQIRGELDGLVQQQMESLKADFGARLTDIEHEAANLKTSTTQQIDIGERAAERTNEHVNNEIIEMNRKLDGVNLRLSNMEAQLTELSPAVNQYRTEGVQAMQNLIL